MKYYVGAGYETDKESGGWYSFRHDEGFSKRFKQYVKDHPYDKNVDKDNSLIDNQN